MFLLNVNTTTNTRYVTRTTLTNETSQQPKSRANKSEGYGMKPNSTYRVLLYIWMCLRQTMIDEINKENGDLKMIRRKSSDELASPSAPFEDRKDEYRSLVNIQMPSVVLQHRRSHSISIKVTYLCILMYT